MLGSASFFLSRHVDVSAATQASPEEYKQRPQITPENQTPSSLQETCKVLSRSTGKTNKTADKLRPHRKQFYHFACNIEDA